MDNRELDYIFYTNQIKKILSEYKNIKIENIDLQDSGIEPSIYSNDLNIYRNENDHFIYIYDELDEARTKIYIDAVKTIIHNLAVRKAEEAFELSELEKFLNTRDDE